MLGPELRKNWECLKFGRKANVTRMKWTNVIVADEAENLARNKQPSPYVS